MARVGGWILCLVVLVTLPGCGGCRNQDDQKTDAEKEAERLAEERERKKPDFEIDPPRAEPCADPLLAEKDEEKIAPFFYKPGHWTSAIVPTKANKEDFLGDLEVQLVSGPERVPVRLGEAPFSLAESREATLPKGQKKLLARLGVRAGRPGDRPRRRFGFRRGRGAIGSSRRPTCSAACRRISITSPSWPDRPTATAISSRSTRSSRRGK